jgi:hypothetical protein
MLPWGSSRLMEPRCYSKLLVRARCRRAHVSVPFGAPRGRITDVLTCNICRSVRYDEYFLYTHRTPAQMASRTCPTGPRNSVAVYMPTRNICPRTLFGETHEAVHVQVQREDEGETDSGWAFRCLNALSVHRPIVWLEHSLFVFCDHDETDRMTMAVLVTCGI